MSPFALWEGTDSAHGGQLVDWCWYAELRRWDHTQYIHNHNSNNNNR